MKKLYLCMCLAFSCIHVCAETFNALKMHLISGNHVICLLDEQPVVTFINEELILKTHMSQVNYRASDVLKFTYERIESESIYQTKITQSLFWFIGNSLVATGLDPKSQITITSVDGTYESSAEISDAGTVSVVLPEQAGNIYIVNTTIANFKISKP